MVQEEYSMNDGYDNIFNSPSAEDSFEHATLIAERFSLTSFKPFQKIIINASLEGRDTMVYIQLGVVRAFVFNSPHCTRIKKL